MNKKCEGCYHRRFITSDLKACHYSIDTDTLRGCKAEDCTHWISKADWCKQNSTNLKRLYKRVHRLFKAGMSLEEICGDTGFDAVEILDILAMDVI